MPPNSFIQWVVDINFGNTPHTEQLTLQLATTETGFRVDMYDIAGMSRASNITGWQDRAPFWSFPAQAAGSYNLTYNSGPYPTLSLSGIHRFVIEIANPNTTLQNTMTFTLGNGSASTASVSGTPFFHPITVGPSSGM